MTDPTCIVMIRHAQARAWADHVVGGPKGCTGLTGHGRAQAEALRDRLLRTGELRGAVLLCSALPRAIETAHILRRAIGDLEAVQDCDLCELHPGESDGMPFADYQATMGFDMRDEPERPIAPGGESLRTFHHRVVAAVAKVEAEHRGRRVAIVTHGGFITAASRWLMETAPLYERSKLFLDPANTSLTEWSLGESSLLVRFNDAAHLHGVADGGDVGP